MKAEATVSNGIRVVMAMNRKGGCGKSTLIKGLASAAAARGEVVTIFDTDSSESQYQWKLAGEAAGNWSDKVAVLPALSAPRILETIDEIYDQPDQEHLILIDTFGGGTSAQDDLATASHLIVAPVMQSRTDVTETMQTLMWHERLKARVDDPSRVPPMRVLVNRLPTRMTEPDRAAVAEILKTMPALDEFVMNRSSYARMDLEGLLGCIRDNIANRAVAQHIDAAITEMTDVLDKLDAIIRGEAGNG